MNAAKEKEISEMSTIEIAVLGGGIIGTATALKILEALEKKDETDCDVKVTLISEKFSPNTTGDGSAGLWSPYLLGKTPKKLICKWSEGMHSYQEDLWLSRDAGEAGVTLIPVTHVVIDERGIERGWEKVVYGFKRMSEKQLAKLNEGRTKKFVSGVNFIAYTTEPRNLLPYMTKRFREKGGRILKKHVADLYDFVENSDYDVVVNCLGLGAKDAVPDPQMYPIRGQVARVKAPWVKHAILDNSEDGSYVIPNMDSVVLGGTHQVGDYNTLVSPADKRDIEKRCKELNKSLQNATHKNDWVGLRPGRTSVRLELEKFKNKVIIHNYGHGGSGVTLSWGCAESVVELLREVLKPKAKEKQKAPQSKL